MCICGYNVLNINNRNNVYGVVILPEQCHCESLLSSLDKCSTSAEHPPTIGETNQPEPQI